MKIPHDMLTKHSGCPYCNGSKPALYNEEWVKKHTPLPYHYLSGYSGMKNKCLFHCDNCNQDFFQTPSRLINQHIYGCGCCPTKKKTNEEFLKKISSEYEVLDQYINADAKLHFKHIPCGTVFELSPDKLINRYNLKYCPVCYYKKSHGEIRILNWLNQHHINYKKEYSFQDLPLKRFDFYLPDLNVCIEYDGKQHFAPIDFFGGEKEFQAAQIRDIEKNQYCIKNKIILFRIPYTDFNEIEKILYQIFEEKSSETIEKYKIY